MRRTVVHVEFTRLDTVTAYARIARVGESEILLRMTTLLAQQQDLGEGGIGGCCRQSTPPRWRSLGAQAIDRDRLVAGLRALESWLVRRMTMRLTAQNYNRVMLEVLNAMSAADDPVAGMIDHLRSYDDDTPTGWWPTDERFRSHLLELPLYGSITQARVRLLLMAAEARLHTAKTEKVPLPTKLTIEHVIPQTWKDTWPLEDPDDESALARRVASIHRLGNLTLVTSSLNPALSNDPWAEKRGELAQHSALRLNARLVHDHPDTFDEDMIDARGHALTALMIAEWPGPDSDDWG